jgi:hypothetical protein
VDVLEDEHRRPIAGDALHELPRHENSASRSTSRSTVEQQRQVLDRLGVGLEQPDNFSRATSGESLSKMPAACFTCWAKAP